MMRRKIKVDYLSRVEGEASLNVSIQDGKVDKLQLSIFEPPRFFEAFLRDRDFREAPDITARICGICPVAYQMSAVHAMEDACGITVGEPYRSLRRLIYCAEWIESHTLHIYMLHAPDFLGYDGAVDMARDHGQRVEDGLQLKKAGNDLVALLGGREIHPISVKVGGFYRVPTKSELAEMKERLKRAQDVALETVKWVATFDFPDFEQDYEFVALRHTREYPFNEGRMVSSKGLDIAAKEFDDHFLEHQVPHSNALHATMKGRSNYFVGPLARYNLNFDRLSDDVKGEASDAGLGAQCLNPYKSIIVRALEVLHCCEEALRIIESYVAPEKPAIDIEPRAGTGYACTEAPRGLLYHAYALDPQGIIQSANIVPPTSQNQMTIEEDLRTLILRSLDLSDGDLQWQCEQAVRNYDPCISCATHFLRLDIDRGA